MLRLTDRAISKVREVLSSQPETESYSGIRVSVEGGGCSGFQYAMNLEQSGAEGDHVVQADGFKVFVDPQSLLYLEGSEIDYIETPEGAGFKFNNPNVRSTCGCGESFQA